MSLRTVQVRWPLASEIEKLIRYESGQRLIIRDHRDCTYPLAPGSIGFSWCRTNFFAVSNSSLELLLGFATAIIDRGGFWKILQSEDEDFGQDESKFHRINVKKIGRIQASRVIRVVPDGDQYYAEPHVFIDTPDHGEWFAPFTYRRVSNDDILDPASRL